MLLLSVQIQEVYPIQYEGQTGTLPLKHKTPWIKKKKRNFYVFEKIKGRVFFFLWILTVFYKMSYTQQSPNTTFNQKLKTNVFECSPLSQLGIL